MNPIIKRSKYFRRQKIIVLTQALVVALQRSYRSVSKVLKGFEKVASMNSSNSKDNNKKEETTNLNKSNVRNVPDEMNDPPPSSGTRRGKTNFLKFYIFINFKNLNKKLIHFNFSKL